MLKINEDFRDLIVPLSKEEFGELEKSVLAEGIRDPICIWNGVIIDGHHRYKLAEKHGLGFKTLSIDFDNIDDAKIWIIENQLARRNLGPARRIDLELEKESLYKKKVELIGRKNRELFKSTGKRLPGYENEGSNRTRYGIAKAAGVGHGQVFRFEEVKKKASADVLKKVLDDEVTIAKAYSNIKREEKKAKRIAEMEEAAKYYKKDEAIQIVHADFYPWCNENTKDDSIDLILTDPPYPKEFLHVWGQLGEIAARTLKPNGYLVTYSGQLYLDYVMKTLGEYLSYCWMVSLYHTGATQLVHPRKVIGTWKPILIYKKGEPGKFDNALVDSITDDYREKDFHEWGQGESAVGYLMKVFSKPNDLVLEPFAGGGTTLVVANDLKRRCIGIDIEAQCMDAIKSNLAKPKTIGSIEIKE